LHLSKKPADAGFLFCICPRGLSTLAAAPYPPSLIAIIIRAPEQSSSTAMGWLPELVLTRLGLQLVKHQRERADASGSSF
jgi:hypothetical protein